MKKYRFVTRLWLMVLFISLIGNAMSQTVQELYTIIDYPVLPSTFCPLDHQMNETSGLIKIGDHLWTLNDSGGKAELYRIDPKTGKAIQTLKITNATNVDWESMAEDEDFIYIGDFGNNLGNRTDLKIYKVSKAGLEKDVVLKTSAEIIHFSYADQNTFEIRNRNHNYDCEALIVYQDSLILFSKNWGNGETRMYKVAKTPGTYTLKPRDIFDVDGLITGADWNKEVNDLVLVGYKDRVPFIFLFTQFNGQKLGTDNVYRFNLNKMKNGQTEGICFHGKNQVYFSTEQTKAYEQEVFDLNLAKILDAIKE